MNWSEAGIGTREGATFALTDEMRGLEVAVTAVVNVEAGTAAFPARQKVGAKAEART
jgi:hypothetical protein